MGTAYRGMGVNDAAFEETCDRLRRLTDWWSYSLLPGNVEAIRYFHRTAAEFRVVHDTPGADACAVSRWQYLQVELHFNVEQLWRDDRSDAYLEKVVIHELTHYILDELVPREETSGPISMHLERVTSALTYAFASVRDRARAMPRRYTPVEGEY